MIEPEDVEVRPILENRKDPKMNGSKQDTMKYEKQIRIGIWILLAVYTLIIIIGS